MYHTCPKEWGNVGNEPCQRSLKGMEAWLWQEFQSMQEYLVQEQIEPGIYEYLLVQMTLLKCHGIEDKLQSLQPEL